MKTKSGLLTMAVLMLLGFSPFLPEAVAAFTIEYQAPGDPTAQGFRWLVIGSSAPQINGPITNDSGFATWAMEGASRSCIYDYISGGLSPAEKTDIANSGFTLTLKARVLRGNAPAYNDSNPTVIGRAVLDTGDRKYTLWLGLNTNDNTVAVLANYVDTAGPSGSVRAFGPSYTLPDSGYHSYQLVYDPESQSASLLIDGVERISGYTGNAQDVGNDGLFLGSVSGGGMNFNLVKLTSPAAFVPPTIVVYSNDFSAGAGPEWSDPTTATANGESFLGASTYGFGNGSDTLTLTNLPAHGKVQLSFDLYLIDSWGGNNKSSFGPDDWQLTANGTNLLLTSFAMPGLSGTQTYPNQLPPFGPGGSFPPCTCAIETGDLGFGSRSWDDSIYHLSFTFDHKARSLALTFTSLQNELPGNEGWGLDNVRVSVFTSQYLDLTLGSTVLRAGETGSVPVTLISPNPVTNLAMTVDFPAGLLTNWTVQPLVSDTCTVTVSNGCQLCLAFTPASGQSLVNTQQLGQITFIAASNQPSAFLPLHITEATAPLADGTPTQDKNFHNGEVVVIHTNSLLRMLPGANGQPDLTLYGLPGTNYTIEVATHLMPPVTWRPVDSMTLTNFIRSIGDMGMTNATAFYRAQLAP